MNSTYFFNKTNLNQTMSLQRQAINLIAAFFYKGKSLVGKPVFNITPDKVVIQLFYYQLDMTTELSNETIAKLGNALTRCWGRPVELRLVELQHGVLDSSIFAQYLTANSNKYSFNRILDMLKTSIPTVVSEGSINKKTEVPVSHLTGFKMKLSGRLTTQRSGPRQTIQAGRIGTSAKGVYNIIDYSNHTSKNKLGAFTIKIWTSQQNR